MKTKVKRRLKRVVACALCMVMLGASLLIANAATSACTHKITKKIQGAYVGIESYNEGQHMAQYTYSIVCDACGSEVFSGIESVGESHSMSYTDAGHVGIDAHQYRFTCSKCGFSTLGIIYCPGGNSHAKP